MGLLDHQLMVKNESTYNTPVVVDRTYEYESESINDDFRRTASDPLRTGGEGFLRSDRFVPFYGQAAGPVSMTVLSKGFGWWLLHMLGGSATTGPAETVVYTHTGTPGSLQGDSFTLQVNRPFNPAGTNQAFTFSGGKIPSWTLSNSVEETLIAELNLDFASATTATALATASYPTAMEPLTWVGGIVTVGGSNFDVTEFSVSGDNGMNTDRRQIRQNATKKEPTTGRREVTFSMAADFDSLAQRNRAASTTASGALAAITATWKAPTLLGSTIYPELSVTIPAGRLDEWTAPTEGPDAINQTLSGVALYDGSNAAITIAYKSADTVA